VDKTKLKLRKLRQSDVVEMKRALDESGSAYLGAFLEWGRRVNNVSLSELHHIVREDIESSPPSEHFVIQYGNSLVGFASFGRSSFENGIQVTYWVRRRFSGKGIAKWLLIELVVQAFFLRNYDFIEIHTDKENIASARIPEQYGFSQVHEYTEKTPAGYMSSGKMIVWALENPKNRIGRSIDKFVIGRLHRPNWGSLAHSN
jgi:RimJ/RimL family protein N-acetyltransferase